MHRLTALAAAALLAACGSSSKLSADDVRAALPSAAEAQVGAPGARVTGSGLAAPAAGPAALLAAPADAVAATVKVGDPSGTFQTTYALAVTMNASVFWALEVVRFVAALPPTSCGESSCTWGPFPGEDGQNDWKLTATRSGDAYLWAISGQRRSAPQGFVPVVSGSATPGASRYRGHGSFLVDHAAAAQLGGSPGQTGTLAVTYDNRAAPHLEATFLGYTDAATGEVGNAAYQFDGRSADGAGELQLGVRNVSAGGQLRLHSRWDAAGAGRGDAEASAPLVQVRASECWSGAAPAPGFRVVYHADPGQPEAGAEAACAFSPAAWPTIAVP